jgi:tetratricopeptide (TPR) repeat protein
MKPKLAGHPQIYEYLRRYQEDPTSRVFAPLAEAYRKAGLVDEAIQIARDGLRIHPHFIGGRVALARCLFDKKLYDDVVQELAKVVEDVPDNLVAQRLIAESYLMLGRVSEALSAYKMLLYFSPSDAETAKIVQELEAQAYERGVLVLRTDPQIPEFAEKSANEAIEGDPGLKKGRWIAKIERLQTVLQKVERYRARTHQI